jgi:RNA polymerase sigma factor for flagellar operon FliA
VPEFPATNDLNPDVLTCRRELQSVLLSAMKELPPRYQAVIHYYYAGGKTMREIGEALHINESRVSQIHRAALERMAQSLQAAGIHSTESML